MAKILSPGLLFGRCLRMVRSLTQQCRRLPDSFFRCLFRFHRTRVRPRERFLSNFFSAHHMQKLYFALPCSICASRAREQCAPNWKGKNVLFSPAFSLYWSMPPPPFLYCTYVRTNVCSESAPRASSRHPREEEEIEREKEKKRWWFFPEYSSHFFLAEGGSRSDKSKACLAPWASPSLPGLLSSEYERRYHHPLQTDLPADMEI